MRATLLALGRRLSRIAAIVLVVGSLLFLGRYIADGFVSGGLVLSVVSWRSLVASMSLLALGVFSGALGWMMILRALGEPVTYRAAVTMWVPALMSKYLPGGGVAYILGRMYISAESGLGMRLASFATVLEMALILVSACLTFVLSLLAWPNPPGSLSYWFALVIVPVGLAGFHPKVLTPVFKWWMNVRRKRDMLGIETHYRTMLGLLVYYCLHWLLIGMAFFLLVRAFWPVSVANIFVFAGIYAIGSSAGMLAIFAPNGLGVRELAIAGMLSIFMPGHLASAIAMLARLWYISGEVEGLLLVGALHLFQKIGRGG